MDLKNGRLVGEWVTVVKLQRTGKQLELTSSPSFKSNILYSTLEMF